MESLVLFKDITGWAKAGGGFVEWIDEYDAAVWESKKIQPSMVEPWCPVRE